MLPNIQCFQIEGRLSSVRVVHTEVIFRRIMLDVALRQYVLLIGFHYSDLSPSLYISLRQSGLDHSEG